MPVAHGRADRRPIERREGRDFFGNHLTWIELNERHDRLIVTAIARVTVDAIAEPSPLATPPWEELRVCAFATAGIGQTPDSSPPSRIE